MNIDFFKCDSHPHLQRLTLTCCIPIIYKPIITKLSHLTYHSATLIDHIYTNSTCKIVSGIAMVDISDHLPVVSVTNIPVRKHNPIKYYRDYSNFD